MDDFDGASVLSEAVHHAALAHVATDGPRWLALVVHTSRDVVLPPTERGGSAEQLGRRLDEGRPLTPLADPDIGSALGDYATRPSSVGDLLAARSTEGERVIGDLERRCALEAARLAPPLAAQLVRDNPRLLASVAARHPAPLTHDGGPLDPAAALCSEVAALLALEMVATVASQLAGVPLSPVAPEPAATVAPEEGRGRARR